MTSIDAKLRLQAQFAEAMQAMAALRREVRGVTGEASATPGRPPFKPLRDGVASVSQQLAEARSQLLAFIGLQAGVQGVSSLAQLSDGYAGLTGRLRIVTNGQGEFNVALATSRQLAADYQVPLASTVMLYTRMLGALRPLGGGLREARTVTESLLAALRITGATTEESASAILQFSQALGAGALRGEEFNAIAEAAPRLLDALARGLGRPREELKSLAEQGKLTTSAVVGALQRELPALQAEAAKMPASIGGAVQRVRDSFGQLVGSTAESSAGIRTIITLLRSVADNLPALISAVAALVALVGALRLGAFAEGLIAAGRAAGVAATGFSGLMLALRTGLGLMLGPVGWIVTLGSLAAAWIALRSAQAKDRTLDTVRNERAAVQAELDALRAQMATSKGTAPQALLNARENEAKLRRLDAEMQRLQQAEWDRLRQQAGPRGGPALGEGGTLRDPQTIREFEKDNQTRERISKEFADKRAAYIVAKDKDIAAARLAGDRALEQRLLDEKAGALREQSRAEQEALRKFSADQTVTRLASYREQFDRVAELIADAGARELRANQALFDQQLRSSQDYFAERERLENLEAQRGMDRLRAELAQREAVLARNREQLGRAATANEREQAREAVAANEAEVERVRAEIDIAQRDASERAGQRAADLQAVTRELRDQRAEADYQTKALRDQVTLADLRLAIERRYAQQREREFIETGDTTQTDALIAAELRVAELDRLGGRYQVFFTTLQQQEAQLDQLVERGAITTEEAERRKFAARAGATPQLRAILQAMRELAQTPADIAAIDNLEAQLSALENQATALQNTMRTSVSQGFGQFFTDVATGSVRADKAFGNFLGNIAKAALNFIGQRLGERLAKSLMPPGGGDGWLSSVGSFFAGLFHDGGIVGMGGARIVVPALAFAAAPRYHSGGIAGLRPNEVPAVLEAGEEVLRRDDPRHVLNGGRSVGGVNVQSSIVIQGAQGSEGNMRSAAEDLERQMESLIDSWAIKHSFPGGLLYRGN